MLTSTTITLSLLIISIQMPIMQNTMSQNIKISIIITKMRALTTKLLKKSCSRKQISRNYMQIPQSIIMKVNNQLMENKCRQSNCIFKIKQTKVFKINLENKVRVGSTKIITSISKLQMHRNFKMKKLNNLVNPVMQMEILILQEKQMD